MDFKTAAEMRYNITPAPSFQEPMVYSKEIQEPRCGILIAQGFYNGLNYYVKKHQRETPYGPAIKSLLWSGVDAKCLAKAKEYK